LAPYSTQATAGAKDLLDVPLRIVHIALGMGFAAATVTNLAFGVVRTGAACGAATAMIFVAWRIARAGRINASAVVTFYTLCAILAALALAGHGTRDYGLIAICASIFAASAFLRPAAYWILAATVMAGVGLLALAEMHGFYHPLEVRQTGTREFLNLMILVGAASIGGRGLMFAMRSAFRREEALSGALRSSQERMEKFFRSSQNPMTVSRLEDGTYYEMNDAYLALFGYGREEIIGRSALEIGLWEDPADRVRFAQQMREQGVLRHYETRMRKRSGEVIEVQVSAELADIGGESCLLASIADVTGRREAERRAERLSTRDAVTGLPNRAAALDRVQHAIQRADASGSRIAFIHLDIDRFKAINDAVGYAAGDTLLREFAARLKSASARGDTVARIAGDEFLVIAEALERPEDAQAAAARLVKAVSGGPFLVDGRELAVTATAGVSVGPEYAIDGEHLLRRADTAMHVAKDGERGSFRLYDEAMSERVRDRLFVETSLRAGIARGELRLVYQPKFLLETGAVMGLEALVRWRHPGLGEVAPSVFIPIAEESDLIHELGAWVLGEACSQLSRWQAQGLACVPVAVNLSAPQFTPELPRLVAEAIRAHGLAPELIELEVTESLLIKNPESARRLLQQVSARGSRIVLDDFGVGYSSLSYVKELDLDGIKIDRSFVRDLVGSRHDGAIVRAIVGLAHGLGLRVVGEGVEFEAQARILKELGCDEGQGFYFSRPLPGEEIGARFLAASTQPLRVAG
jgi:diguanylate cyclase (GGDEF)-like protein/PAS domain S-box-containing protein